MVAVTRSKSRVAGSHERSESRQRSVSTGQGREKGKSRHGSRAGGVKSPKAAAVRVPAHSGTKKAESKKKKGKSKPASPGTASQRVESQVERKGAPAEPAESTQFPTEVPSLDPTLEPSVVDRHAVEPEEGVAGDQPGLLCRGVVDHTFDPDPPGPRKVPRGAQKGVVVLRSESTGPPPGPERAPGALIRV